MNRRLFGTDGIRGTANREPISAETVLRVALAAGAEFTRGGHRHRVVIGKDTRLSGYMLEPALTAGFVAMGMDVVLLGPLPTPAVAMLTRSLKADLGVMISASHNPFQDNGIKLFGPDGYKLSDAVEAAIEARLEAAAGWTVAEPAELARGGQALVQSLVHQGLDLQFGLVRQLVAVRPEQLDAVVAEGVVRGRDHDAEVGPQTAGHHRHAWRRQRPEQAHVHAHRGEPRHQRRLDHVAGEPRVLADHHQVAAVVLRHEQLARRHADAKRHLGGHGKTVGLATDTVGPEVGALGHWLLTKRYETQI